MKKQSGFSAVVLLIVIVVLGVVGGVAYRVINSNKDEPVNTQITEPQPSAERQEEITAQPEEATKIFENKDFDFKITTPESWQVKDESGYSEGVPFQLVLNVTTSDNDSVKIYGVVGKGGDCQPNPTDTPHADGNKCGTQEFIKSENIGDSGVLLRYKYSSNNLGTKYGYCYHKGQQDVPKTNDPQMGFVLYCNSGDVFIEVESIKTLEDFDSESAKKIEKALLTINQ